MADLLYGWRKKVGFLFLLMAGIATGLWSRSSFTCDLVAVTIHGKQYRLFSGGGNLVTCLEAWKQHEDATVGVEWESNPFPVTAIALNLQPRFEHRSLQFTPCWSFVLPLTLASALFIVWGHFRSRRARVSIDAEPPSSVKRVGVFPARLQGWRGKLATALLLLAMVATGLWIRSHFAYDKLSVSVGHNECRLFSREGWLCACAGPVLFGDATATAEWKTQPFPIDLDWDFDHREPWSVPYWILVLVTSLSALVHAWGPFGSRPAAGKSLLNSRSMPATAENTISTSFERS